MVHQCRHIKSNGIQCGSPALRDAAFCYFHAKAHRPKPKDPVWADLGFPLLEDPSAIQISVSEVLEAIVCSRLDPRRAGLILYGLQIASQNIERRRSRPAAAPVLAITRTSDGEELAPEKAVPEDPAPPTGTLAKPPIKRAV